ncbi:hydroxyacid dehydrogenase [Agromyces sp. ISL-38]|nr:hydroxyacid dehydrogenase [Agromyces sp. ISL-38]
MNDLAHRMHFDAARHAELERRIRLVAPSPRTLLEGLDDAALAEVEVIVSSWGAPELDEAAMARLPGLRALLHGAGSVRGIVTEALWSRGVEVTSNVDANAVPVAEFALAAIVFAGKQAFRLGRDGGAQLDGRRELGERFDLSNYERTIGIVGFSRIGRRVVELLRVVLPTARILVHDPYVDADAVATAGAELLPLERILPQVSVLSLHAPALDSTRGMIGAAELAALPDGATLVNTARGALVDHAALESACASGRLSAVLDVTEPEPLPADSPLRAMPNVFLTPHIAGSLGSEVHRMTDETLAELDRFRRGEALAHRLTLAVLTTSA